MAFTNKPIRDIANRTSPLVGSDAVKNAQMATNEAIDGMDLFREVAYKRHNVGFDQVKGNLFEYIETAKFNKNAAIEGSTLKAVTTDSIGRPHDPADIEIIDNGRVVRQVQAKFSDSKDAAVDSVFMQKKDKYAGMQRLIRKEDRFVTGDSGQDLTLLDKAKQLAFERASKDGTIYQKQYQDVYDNLTDELNHGGITSGGTTLDEIVDAYNNPDKYARKFEIEQLHNEAKITSINLAAASMITAGLTSGIANMFEVFRDDKELSEALKDVGIVVVENGARGGATGALSSAIRYQGIKKGSFLLSDSMASTVMAGGIIDGGIALYEYATGEIDAQGLKDELINTTAKAATTIYYTKAVTAVMGASVSPFIPMAVYTTANYVVKCTREILREAKLNEAEYNRMTALLDESTRMVNQSHAEFIKYINQCEKQQKEMLESFINDFEYNIQTGENYDKAVNSIVVFAGKAGIVLQHVEFEDFKNAMNSKQTFKLD